MGERRSVYEGAVAKKAADDWLNRIEHLNACVIASVAPDTDLAAWVAGLPDSSHQKLLQAGIVVRRERFQDSVVTIARLNAAFSKRFTAKPSTIRGFPQTLDSSACSAACSAKCDSARVRIRQYGAAQNDKTRCHHSGCSGFCENYDGCRTRRAAGCRGPTKKKPAGAMDGPAGVKWRGQEANNQRFAREIRGSPFPATRNATRFRPIVWNCSPGR